MLEIWATIRRPLISCKFPEVRNWSFLWNTIILNYKFLGCLFWICYIEFGCYFVSNQILCNKFQFGFRINSILLNLLQYQILASRTWKPFSPSLVSLPLYIPSEWKKNLINIQDQWPPIVISSFPDNSYLLYKNLQTCPATCHLPFVTDTLILQDNSIILLSLTGLLDVQGHIESSWRLIIFGQWDFMAYSYSFLDCVNHNFTASLWRSIAFNIICFNWIVWW